MTALGFIQTAWITLHLKVVAWLSPTRSQVWSLQERQRDLNKDTGVSGKPVCTSEMSPKERQAHVWLMEAEEQHETEDRKEKIAPYEQTRRKSTMWREKKSRTAHAAWACVTDLCTRSVPALHR